MGVLEPAHRALRPGGSIPRRALAQLQYLLPPSLVARRAALRRRICRQRRLALVHAACSRRLFTP
eukprot:5758448-Prymnesium_polylepis.1